MTWQIILLVLAGAMLHAGWNVSVKSSTDKILETGLIHLFCSIIAMPVAFYFGAPPKECWPFLIISVLIHLGYYFTLANAYQHGELGLAYPLMRGTAPLFVAIGSYYFIPESTMSIWGWSGVFLICAGVILIGISAGLMQHKHAILIAMLNAILIASYTLADAAGIRISENPIQYIASLFAIDGWLFCAWVFLLKKKVAIDYAKKRWTYALGGASASITSYSIALWAMTVAPVAAIAALRETSVLFAILFGAWFLNEKINGQRLLSIFMIVLGAMAIRFST
jgi:phosphonate utilization associated putative membrane protein